jgi:hypothetical protein
LIENDNIEIDNESTKLEASVISSKLGIVHDDRENCVHKPTKCVQNTTSSVCSSTECVHDDSQCVQNNTTCVQKEVNKDAELMTDSNRTVSEVASDKEDLNVQENKVDIRFDVKIVQHKGDSRCKENESDVGIGVAIIPHETGKTLGENDEVVDVTGEIHLVRFL